MANQENFSLDDYEREILQKSERDELASVPDVQKEIEIARRASRSTLDRMSETTDDGTGTDPN